MRKPGLPEHKGPPSPFAYASIGFEVVVPIVLFILAGYKLDGWLETEPWLLLIGALLGIAVGFYSFYRRVLPLVKGRGGSGQ